MPSRDEIMAMTPSELQKEMNWMSITDLSEAYRLEEGIPENQRMAYWLVLMELVLRGDMSLTFDPACVTAEQRCRAWLLWKEGAK